MKTQILKRSHAKTIPITSQGCRLIIGLLLRKEIQLQTTEALPARPALLRVLASGCSLREQTRSSPLKALTWGQTSWDLIKAKQLEVYPVLSAGFSPTSPQSLPTYFCSDSLSLSLSNHILQHCLQIHAWCWEYTLMEAQTLLARIFFSTRK